MEPKPKLGRNDPCRCGSGKKYKNCHLREDEAAASSERRKNGLIRQLGEYALQRRFEKDFEAAAAFFYGDKTPPPRDEQEQEVFAQRALDYFIYDYPLANEQRLIEHFIAEVGKRLSSEERHWLGAWAYSRLAAYEVIALRRGEGLRLRDLVSGEEFEVLEKRGTEQVSRWDVLFTRVMRVGDHFELSASGLYVPVRFRDWLRGYIEELWSDYRFRHSDKAYEDFLHASSQLVNQFILNEIEPVLNRPPTIVTAEGDLMEQCTSTYDVLDYAMALAGLRGAEEFVQESEDESEAGASSARQDLHLPPGVRGVERASEEKSFSWYEAGESLELLQAHGPDFEHHDAIGEERGGTRLLGHLTLSPYELELQTTSQRRMDAGEELLAKRLGAAIQRREGKIESAEELLARLPEEEAEEEEEEEEGPSEEWEELQAELAAKEQRKWLDRDVPALDDQTPREAVKSLAGRVRVIRLLKEFESAEAHRARRGEIPLDVDELKHELGLTDQEFSDESRLEDQMGEALGEIEELALEDRVDEALAAWRAFRARYPLLAVADLDFAEVSDLPEILDETLLTLEYRLAMYKRFDEAAALLGEYIALTPEDLDELRGEMAVLHAERGEVEQAVRELETLASQEDAEFAALSKWAEIEYALLNRPDRALELWRRADEFAADEAEGAAVYEAILQIYLDTRRLDEAEHFWHEENDAEGEADQDYVSWVWIMLARGDLPRAREGAEKISQETSRLYWRGMVEAQAGNFATARELWKDELTQLPAFDAWGFWASWAELHLRLREPAPVLAKIDPVNKQKHASAYCAVALAHALEGNLHQAAEWAARARRAMEERERRMNWSSTFCDTRDLAEAIGLSEAARQALGV